MTAFRRRPNKHTKSRSVLICDVQTNPVVENGVVINKEVVSVLTAKDYFELHPIAIEDYSINEQVSAGVPLKEIPCGSRLDSNDNLDYDVNETAEETLFAELQKEIKTDNK